MAVVHQVYSIPGQSYSYISYFDQLIAFLVFLVKYFEKNRNECNSGVQRL